MSTVTELKELYVKLGGKLSDVKGIQTDEEMIEKIAKTKLGIELPVVGTSDNGNLLAVSGGTWGKAILSVSIDENYVLSIGLEDEDGTLITAETIDLPLESMFVDIELSGDNLIITLQNGNSITVSLSSLFSDIKIDELTYYEPTGSFVESEEQTEISLDDYPIGNDESVQHNPSNLLPINNGFRLYPSEGKTIADYAEKVWVVYYDENGNYINTGGSGELYPETGGYFEIKIGGQEGDLSAAKYVAIGHNSSVEDMILVRMEPITNTKKVAVNELIKENNVYKYSSTNNANTGEEINSIPNDAIGILITESTKDLQVEFLSDSDSMLGCYLANEGTFIPFGSNKDYIYYVHARKSEKYGGTPSVGEVQFSYAWVTDIKNESESIQELINNSGGVEVKKATINATTSATGTVLLDDYINATILGVYLHAPNYTIYNSPDNRFNPKVEYKIAAVSSSETRTKPIITFEYYSVSLSNYTTANSTSVTFDIYYIDK